LGGLGKPSHLVDRVLDTVYARALMRRGWGGLPPVMQRTLRHDLMWAFAVLLGAALGYLTIGGEDTSALLGAVVGVVVVIVVLALLRRVRPRRKT
jgi:hypothetical protein